MSRRRLAAWSVALPLMVAGSQVAHVFAYRLVYPQTQLRLHALLVSGHGYMGHVSLLFALCAVIELIALCSAVAGSFRRGAATPLPAWAFGLIPPLGFAVQEFLERWLYGASFPWWMVLQPTFRVGLLLQLPFGLAAYLVARLLLRVADRVGRVLSRRRRLPEPVGLLPGWAVSPTWLPRLSVVASHAGRSPPAPAAAIFGCAI
ncbi:MAG TPA: hypothetical protein VEG40_00955 [Gaiellaceae bacterium]|nr:hypothetical protein [Gaiellaceae bacterium]